MMLSLSVRHRVTEVTLGALTAFSLCCALVIAPPQSDGLESATILTLLHLFCYLIALYFVTSFGHGANLDAWRRRMQIVPRAYVHGHCSDCRYDLTGLEEHRLDHVRCPECGKENCRYASGFRLSGVTRKLYRLSSAVNRSEDLLCVWVIVSTPAIFGISYYWQAHYGGDISRELYFGLTCLDTLLLTMAYYLARVTERISLRFAYPS